MTTTSEVTTISAPDGIDGTRISAGPTAWGNACLEFVPTTWYYGAFDGTAIQQTVTTTTTTTYRGRTTHPKKEVSTHTVVAAPTYRVTEGEIYCYGNRLGPYRFEAPYPS